MDDPLELVVTSLNRVLASIDNAAADIGHVIQHAGLERLNELSVLLGQIEERVEMASLQVGEAIRRFAVDDGREQDVRQEHDAGQSQVAELFRVERREDGQWHVVMPDGSTAGHFNAKRPAREQANKYRQQAEDDPTFLKSFQQAIAG